ncbi:hypothetical protein BT96DRAFT_831965, partial [Gymnopus androsaceus JB14]
FTAGIRTSGCLECEHKVLKAVGGPKKTMYEVFNGLNERTNGQTNQDMIHARDLREHAGPYALQTCFHGMQESVFYNTTALQRPEGMRDWKISNDFSNDKAYISTRWLIQLVLKQGLQIRHIFRVKRLGGVATHYVFVLKDGWVVCDCCMQLNLGIPCRHYFHIFTKVEGLTFSIGMIRIRYVHQ